MEIKRYSKNEQLKKNAIKKKFEQIKLYFQETLSFLVIYLSEYIYREFYREF